MISHNSSLMAGQQSFIDFFSIETANGSSTAINFPSSCSPFETTNSTQAACAYVKEFRSICEGGGYIQWTEYIVCTESDAIRAVLIAVSLIVMLILFLTLTTSADEFFCPSIAVIVDHLKISQNLAGITFMAFGNGAPDIFSIIASVLNTKYPKMGLALGDLLGGGSFVTATVLGSIMVTKPYDVQPFDTIRDLSFYLVAAIFMGYMMFFNTYLHVWQPAVYVVMYILYVIVVIAERFVKNLFKKRKHGDTIRSRARTSRVVSRGLSCLSSNNHILPIGTEINIETDNDVVASVTDGKLHTSEHEHDPVKKTVSLNSNSVARVILEDISPTNSNLNLPSIVISPVDEEEQQDDMYVFKNGSFAHENTDDDDSDVVIVGTHKIGRRFTFYAKNDVRSRASSVTVVPVETYEVPFRHAIFIDLWKALCPLSADFRKSNIPTKFLQICKIPIILFCKLIIPQTDDWCKTLSIIHSFTAPIILLFAFGLDTVRPIPRGPQLWVFGLGLSIVIMVFLLVFTKYYTEPRFFKITAYMGFLMSIAIIYAVSSEIVNIITMISAISGIPHELLGLTVLAWSNSIGDFIADRTVARQGFPQMATAAAIGSPLFNLLIGFGVAFLIVTAQGKQILMTNSLPSKALLVLLIMSLVITLVLLFVNRFRAKRWHGIILIVVYFAMLTVIILIQLKVISI